MNDEGLAAVLIASLTAVMGTVQSIVSWGVVLAVGAGWAALRKPEKEDIDIAGLSMNRKEAFWAASFIYTAATVAILGCLLRIHAILSEIHAKKFVEAYVTLAAHEWLLNPFGYLGTSWAARYSIPWGIGLVILSWWVCATSVVVLRGKERFRKTFLLLLLFYAAGLVTLWVFYKIYEVNLARLQTLAPAIYNGIRATATWRWVFAIASVPVGVGLVAAVWGIQRREEENARRSRAASRSQDWRCPEALTLRTGLITVATMRTMGEVLLAVAGALAAFWYFVP